MIFFLVSLVCIAVPASSRGLSAWQLLSREGALQGASPDVRFLCLKLCKQIVSIMFGSVVFFHACFSDSNSLRADDQCAHTESQTELNGILLFPCDPSMFTRSEQSSCLPVKLYANVSSSPVAHTRPACGSCTCVHTSYSVHRCPQDAHLETRPLQTPQNYLYFQCDRNLTPGRQVPAKPWQRIAASS